MGKSAKLFLKVLDGRSDNNLRFIEICNLLIKLGFQQRIKGSHHIFYSVKIQEILNLQDNNGFTKAYQTKQVREIIIKYNLKLIEEDEI